MVGKGLSWALIAYYAGNKTKLNQHYPLNVICVQNQVLQHTT